ncbi:SDR family oxidoreductase [soil metagenome]
MSSGANRLVAVVGGASGIGEAVCRVMAGHGWRVAVLDVNGQAANELAQSMGAAHHARADVTDEASLSQALDALEKACGPVHAMVNTAAAFQPVETAGDTPATTWARIVDVNLHGAWNAARVFGTRMAGRGGGVIVNFSSAAAELHMPPHGYGASKAAVRNLTSTLAVEWGRKGVRVVVVTPGVTLVPRVKARIESGERYKVHPDKFTALGRLVEPDEVAETVEFLCSDRASAITGSNFTVDAGFVAAAGWSIFGGPPGA